MKKVEGGDESDGKEQWRLVVKLAGRAAKFHLWLQDRRQDLAAVGAKN